MLCTTMFRTTWCYLNRAPTLFSKQGHAHQFLGDSLAVCNGASATGLLTSKHIASISKACGLQNSEIKMVNLMKKETNVIFNSQKRCYWQKYTGTKMDMQKDELLRQRVIEKLQNGEVQVPELRNVTSLPPVVDLDNSQFVALDVKTVNMSTRSDLFSIHAVSDTEQFIKICRYDGELSDFVRKFSGLDYDENGNLCWSKGPVETVEPQEAVQELIKFLKKYDNAVLLVYESGANAVQRLRYHSNHCGLYDEFISAGPYYIDLVYMIRKNIPRSSVQSYKVQDLCRELLDMDVSYGDTISRLTGMKMLFTDVLLPRESRPLINCTDYFRAKDCYAQMVANNHIHPIAVEKLANAGLRHDHLKFLKEQGEDVFKEELIKRKVFEQDVAVLFSLV